MNGAGATEADGQANHRSDVGRRVAQRREELGLSREAVAERAGVAPEYLRYLEEHQSSPSVPSLTRVARALQTTVADLSGVTALSAAPASRSGRTEPTELSPEECRKLLASHSVGRVAVSAPTGPAIVPVNYTFTEEEDAVIYRTELGSTSAEAEGDEVAFEVDRLDETLRVGWTVMVSGEARRVTDPAEAERLASRARAQEWEHSGGPAETRRWLWMRVAAERVSGTRVSLG
ncbi:helix-turn-helix domain-containing protein [Streptomyces sp. 4N509B]|uniref:helix-turn-helix domain-containing protein n=1 Tax=Streptomyces sp. 4N509B TaxID=3457413 RepID=UPI003FCFCA9F